MRRLTTDVLVVLAWAAMITLGRILAETVMLYPNTFRAPSNPLLAPEFAGAGGPAGLFPPPGPTVIVPAVLSRQQAPIVGSTVTSATSFTGLLRRLGPQPRGDPSCMPRVHAAPVVQTTPRWSKQEFADRD